MTNGIVILLMYVWGLLVYPFEQRVMNKWLEDWEKKYPRFKR